MNKNKCFHHTCLVPWDGILFLIIFHAIIFLSLSEAQAKNNLSSQISNSSDLSLGMISVLQSGNRVSQTSVSAFSFGKRYRQLHEEFNINSISTSARLSYGHDLSMAATRINIDAHTVWPIQKGKSKIKKGRGFDLLNYKFEKPGNYKLSLLIPSIENSDVCNHGTTDQIVLLEVSNAHIDFLVDESTFSKKLFAGINLKDVYVELPVEISFFKKNKEEFDFTYYHIAGATRLHLSMEASEIRGVGRYMIRHYLSGSITYKGYYAINIAVI